jgi:hypothetical protein
VIISPLSGTERKYNKVMKENILFILGFVGLFAAMAAIENYPVESAWVLGIGFGVVLLGTVCHAVGSIFLD